MDTQLLIKFEPNRAFVLPPYTEASSEYLPTNDQLLEVLSPSNEFSYRPSLNPNWASDIYSVNLKGNKKRLANIDLYEDVAIPLNYTILDVREPDKRKTNFSKTIRLPGTKNNNQIFNHVYEISGNSKFNPNIRTEVVILQKGVQVMRGNMQLKNMVRFNNDDVEYEVIITGDFTSLFADIGLAKLSDLDFSEYNHYWTRTNIVNSWNNNVMKNGQLYSAKEFGGTINFNNILRDENTGRIKIQSTVPHGVQEGDWIRIFPDENDYGYEYVYGEWQVAEIINFNTFTINHPYPDGLFGSTVNGYYRKWQPTGEGYVYGMVSWGDDNPNALDPISNSTQLPTFPVTNFVMGFYVKEIWDKIFKETNSTYDSEFLNSDFFKRLTVFQKKTSYDLQQSEIQGRSFKVANTTPHSVRVSGFGTNNSGSYSEQYRSYPFNQTYYQPYQFNADIATSGGILYNGIEGSEPYNFSTNKFKVTDSGNYDLNFSIVLQLETIISSYDISGTFNPPIDPAVNSAYKYYWGGVDYENQDVEVYVKLIKRSNGLTSVVTQEFLYLTRTDGELDTPVKNTFKNWTWLPKQATLTLTNQYFTKDDEIWVELSYRALLDNDNKGTFLEVKYEPGVPGGQQPSPPRWIRTAYRGTVDIKTVGVQYFFNKPNATIVEGSEVFTEQFLPKDMSCKDFLISIIRMFNLHVESDKEIEKHYYIEPRNDYYKTGSNGLSDYVDWTEKVDIKSMEITPMGELNAKFYNFNYKQDNDFWNKKYLEDSGKGYSNYIKEIQNDFLSNEQKISTSFGATVMINLTSDSDIIVPQVVQKDNNNQNKVTNTAAKILLWGGPRPTSSVGVPKKWFLQRTVVDPDNYDPNDDYFRFYPYVGTVDSPYDPLQDLSWFFTDYVYWNRARWTNENLYNKYWAGFIEEISDPDSKLIKANVRLTPKDIYNLDFKKIYVINGHYLRLQKIIDYNAVSNGLTKCEFLKLKSPSKFKRRSIFVNEDFADVELNINGIVNIINKPPQNYVDRYPISNYSESALSGVFNANLNGQNNIISRNSNNISIQGNENFIGSNSNNISINGSGVQVAGGLKNVNIIGTDNIYVEESNVTYVNGIRYKNGVAISKSNVIDGGINSPTGKVSINTTSNVVDGSEDVVISSGSNSYEDVINSGQDRILPDLPNFGVTNQNSVRPTTNYSGVAQNVSGATYSLPQLIEQRIDPVPYSAFNSYPSS